MLEKSDYLTSYDYLNKRLTENDPHYLRQKDGYDGEPISSLSLNVALFLC